LHDLIDGDFYRSPPFFLPPGMPGVGEVFKTKSTGIHFLEMTLSEEPCGSKSGRRIGMVHLPGGPRAFRQLGFCAAALVSQVRFSAKAPFFRQIRRLISTAWSISTGWSCSFTIKNGKIRETKDFLGLAPRHAARLG
jgi:hypothetical protein